MQKHNGISVLLLLSPSIFHNAVLFCCQFLYFAFYPMHFAIATLLRSYSSSQMFQFLTIMVSISKNTSCYWKEKLLCSSCLFLLCSHITITLTMNDSDTRYTGLFSHSKQFCDTSWVSSSLAQF